MSSQEYTFHWSAIAIQPSLRVAASQLFQSLRATRLDEVPPPTGQLKTEYVLKNEADGCRFSIPLTAIQASLAEQQAYYDRSIALEKLRKMLNAEDRDQRSILLSFLYYSPWLLVEICKNQEMHAYTQGIVLARLTDLFATLSEEEALTTGRYADSYALLVRTRFLCLAGLVQHYRSQVESYWLDLTQSLQEAWHTWAQLLLNEPHRLRRILTDSGRNLEVEGLSLLFSNDADKRLWSFCREVEARPFAEEIVTRWLLPRYDLQHATLVIHQLENSSSSWLQRLSQFLCMDVHVGIICLAAPLVLGTLAALKIGVQLPVPLLKWLSFSFALIGNIVWGFVALVTLVLLRQTFFEGTQLLRFNLPRLTLALIGGYVALISSGQLIGAALLLYEQHFFLNWSCLLGSYLLAYGALYIEVRRHLQEQENKLAKQRVRYVLLQAALRSLWIGWLILVPLGPLFLSDVSSKATAHPWQLMWNNGIWGWTIYPHLIFVFSPLALFFGIFIQTIWEDIPVSQPL